MVDKIMGSIWNEVDWVDLVKPGVFGVFDESIKEVYVVCSNNLLRGISNVVTDLVREEHQCSNMANPKIRLLAFGSDSKLIGHHEIQRLTKEGYKVLNKRSPITLTPRIRTIELDSSLLAVVTLRNERGKERVVAAFNHMDDCLPWIEDHYPNMTISEIIELDDELTNKVKRLYE